LSRGDYGVFVEGPINKVLLLVFIAAVLFGMLRPVLARILSRRATANHPIKEPVS
jgi:putative tricarboxylic transport membrane protein